MDRDLLLYALLNFNIDGKVYFAIKAMYTNTFSCLKINNFLTEWFGVNSGVRQEDTLSPTLFAIYINSLAKEIKELGLGIDINGNKVSILLYADDMVLIGKTEGEVQNMLNIMYSWCRKWRMNINIAKSNIIHFRHNKAPETKQKFYFGEKEINLSKSYKYLGVILDEHLTFQECIKSLSDSASRALGSIITKCKSYRDFRFKTFSKLFESGVIPILDYGSVIWGSFSLKTPDIVLNKAARFILGVHRYCPNAMLLGDTGWLRDKYRRQLSLIRFWNRLLNMPIERLTKQIFLWDYEKSYKNWSNDIKKIFSSLDLWNIYDQKQLCNLEVVHEKLRLECEEE